MKRLDTKMRTSMDTRFPMPKLEYIKVDSQKLSGVPTVRHSRFSVAQLLAELAEGRSIGELARDFNMKVTNFEGCLNELAVILDRDMSDEDSVRTAFDELLQTQQQS